METGPETGRQRFSGFTGTPRAQEAAAGYDAVRLDWIIGSDSLRCSYARCSGQRAARATRCRRTQAWN